MIEHEPGWHDRAAAKSRPLFVPPAGETAQEAADRVKREGAEAAAVLLAEVPRRYRHCNRWTWKGDWPSAVDAWQPAPGADPWALLLLGDPGVGKTHVATTLYLKLGAGFRRRRWVSVEDLVRSEQRAIAGRQSGDNRGEGGLDSALDCELLLLDDVGSGRGTEWATALVASVLYHRHEHMAPTIITSNAKCAEDFAVFDHRISSRLREGTLRVLLEGPDRRSIRP